ncbi:MAG: hypothetical protein R3356_06695 [Eudoraea sp.]|nr:hypothetical protein [Eudoraea sp.]
MTNNKGIIAVLLLIAFHMHAQVVIIEKESPVDSPEGIVKEVFAQVSTKPGEKIDLEAFGNLFLPNARFTVLYQDDSFPERHETVSLEEFKELLTDEYYQKGFTQYELGKRVDQYNGIAQVFQSYEGKDADGYTERGIASYQLIYLEDRWWILSVLWTGDSNGVAIPKQYLDPE